MPPERAEYAGLTHSDAEDLLMERVKREVQDAMQNGGLHREAVARVLGYNIARAQAVWPVRDGLPVRSAPPDRGGDDQC